MLITVLSLNFSYFDRLLVRVEAEKLYITCRRLQQQALSSNRPTQLTFDTAHNNYCYETTTEKLNRSVSFGFLQGVKGPPSSPTHLITKPITFVQNRIVCTPDGIIQPGSVYLVSTDKQVMYALCSPVSPVSFLRLYHYDGSWHSLP